MGRAMMALAGLGLAAALAGCGCGPVNPSFGISLDEARQDLQRMAREPRPLQRPVLVVGGWADPGLGAAVIAAKLRQATGDDRFVEVSTVFAGSFDDLRTRLLRAVEELCPPGGSQAPPAIDVVAISMGGLAARYAALAPDGGGGALRIVRLFTIGTPHRGARLAGDLCPDACVRDMTPGSPLLARLEAALPQAEYELVCYVRLGDWVVGEANAAPPGQPLWWVATPPLQEAHALAALDPRIIADIARRLRGEAPHTRVPPAPLPGR